MITMLLGVLTEHQSFIGSVFLIIVKAISKILFETENIIIVFQGTYFYNSTVSRFIDKLRK